MKLNLSPRMTQYGQFINRLILRSANVPVIGIDIGTSTVKAVVISKPNGILELGAWAVVPIVGSAVKEALQTALAKISFSSQITVASVSGKGTLIRYVDLPRMPLEELRKSFVYDLDKYFPFDIESIYTDCAILDSKSKDKRMSVMVAAVKKELVDERIQMFKDVGVELSHVTLNSIATANAFERLGPVKQAVSTAKAILDVGGAVSNILVIDKGLPCFTRDIFIGSQDMTRQIGNILGVPIEEAEQLKKSPAGREAEVKDACEAAVSHLVSEIRLSLDYFMSEKNIQVDEFFLLGGGSLLKGIEGVLEKNLGVSVKPWDIVANIKKNAFQIAGDVGVHSSQLGVAVGLGLTNL